MFESITHFFKRFKKSEKEESKSTAKERLHLVLAQDRANISADFLEMMKQEILEVIKKYIDIDEKAIDVRLTNKESDDGSIGAPALYANIPIITIKNEARKLEGIAKQGNEETAEIKADKETNNENKVVEESIAKESNGINSIETNNIDNNIEKPKDVDSKEKENILIGQGMSEYDNINEVNNEEKNS